MTSNSNNTHPQRLPVPRVPRPEGSSAARSEVVREGMRRGDLRHLVSDIVSIDEYNSKIDDSAIVIAFHVQDRNAAQDLNRFVQKSYVDLLDTDVSPAPDQKGFYIVFVELPLNTNISDAIWEICKDISSLADIDQWRMRLRSVKGVQPFNAEIINQVLSKELESQLKEFFKHSDITSFALDNSGLRLYGAGTSVTLPLLEFGPYKRVFACNALAESAINFDASGRMLAQRLQLLLGRNWDVECLREQIAIRCYKNTQILLLTLA